MARFISESVHSTLATAQGVTLAVSWLPAATSTSTAASPCSCRYEAGTRWEIGRRDIDVRQQMLAHPAVMTLKLIGGEAVEFVERERSNAGKIEYFLLVHPDQLAIDADRRAPRRQPEHGRLPLGVPVADHAR